MFFLIQGLSAITFSFKEPIKKAIGEKSSIQLESLHKGKPFGKYAPFYNLGTGLALTYVAGSGLVVYFKNNKRRKK
jgi:hypothetical protein